MKRIEAKFEVVTPCFLGGANHEQEAELRLPSIKGVLRFWWRALNYARIAQKKDSESVIKRLWKEEAELFGSSDQDQSQSSLIMRLIAENSESTKELKEAKEKDAHGMRYLGYGVMNIKGKLDRPCLTRKGKRGSFHPFEFTLQIGAKEQKPLEEILPALKQLGLLGGLGAKSRKGYGSLNLIKLEGDGVDTWQKPACKEEYEDCLRELLKSALGYTAEPEISTFSFKTYICLTKFKSNSAMEVLDEYGKEIVRYRSWGMFDKNRGLHIILGREKSEQNFPEDHDWMKNQQGIPVRIKPPPDFHPRRAVFGLPHNYGKGVGVKPSRREHDRRASPLFFHVHRIGDEFVGVALLLRSQFLPDGEKISANKKPVPFDPKCWEEVLMKFMKRICEKTICPQ